MILGAFQSVSTVHVYIENVTAFLFSNTPPAVALIRKLVAVLESIEKLPVYSYDSPSSGYGLQVSDLFYRDICPEI